MVERRPLTQPHVAVLVTSSYPRFPGDAIGSFMEPIAQGLAARDHEIHVVAPWHPALDRPGREGGVHFHFYKYAPSRRLNVFGYAGAMKADVALKSSAYLAAPFALAAAWHATRRVVHSHGATILHGHWVVPNGPIAGLAAGRRLPLVVSLHGSDVYLAERSSAARLAARWTFGRAAFVTACSDDLAARAARLGAAPDRLDTVPYGVDVRRFQPDPERRIAVRHSHHIELDAPVVFSAGRFVWKKGFEHLIEAVSLLVDTHPSLRVILAGSGDLEQDLRRRVAAAGLQDRVLFPGVLTQDAIAHYLAAADVVVVPSIRDDAGNVDGLPNFALEALASATPVVTTAAGGLARVAVPDRTALVVPERDPRSLAEAVRCLLANRARGLALGQAARQLMAGEYGWESVAARLEAIYDRAVEFHSRA